MDHRVLALIDGENLVFRYQTMLGNGRVPCEDNAHIPDVFVWNNRLLGFPVAANVLRVIFYTSVVGDDPRVEEIRTAIQKEMYALGDSRIRTWDRLSAFVVKKEKNSRKSKTIDMRICIDALAHTMSRNMDFVHLVTGDADFFPLVEEVKRHGIRVWVHALSDGCAPVLRSVGDGFTSLDEILFKPKPP